MDKDRDHLESITHIRSIMERSTTFVSLTGLSGVMAGLFGLLTFVLVATKLGSVTISDGIINRIAAERDIQYFLAVIALSALVVTLLTALILTVRKAKKKGEAIWNSVSRRFAAHMFIPLCAGGLFTTALVLQGQYQLVCPALLLFFGLALLNAARFVQMDMFWLGLVEISLGVIAAFWYEAGLILWAVGFGVSTMIYGILMYFKYER